MAYKVSWHHRSLSSSWCDTVSSPFSSLLPACGYTAFLTIKICQADAHIVDIVLADISALTLFLRCKPHSLLTDLKFLLQSHFLSEVYTGHQRHRLSGICSGHDVKDCNSFLALSTLLSFSAFPLYCLSPTYKIIYLFMTFCLSPKISSSQNAVPKIIANIYVELCSRLYPNPY